MKIIGPGNMQQLGYLNMNNERRMNCSMCMLIYQAVWTENVEENQT